VLRADVYRPEREGRFPVLVYRTPYGKHNAADSYQTHLKAVARGYAVMLQDVRAAMLRTGVSIRTARNAPTGSTRSNGLHCSHGPMASSVPTGCRIRGPCNGWPRWKRRPASWRWRPR
jgi:hypothetical protein